VIRTSCTVAEADVEDAMDVLLPRLPQGVHERDAGAGRRELSWFGGGRLDAELGDLARDWSQEDAPEERPERARRYGQAWIVAGRLVVRAPGAPGGPAGMPEVVIGADRAQFGTGAHPTTRDCLEILAALPPDGGFADLGCGAGVLAVAAARLGFRPVHAVDLEPASVRAARENAAANGVEVDVRQADLLAEPPPAAATLAANVPLAVHRALGPRLAPEVRRVVVSGIVDREAEPALAAYAGLLATTVRETAGWRTMLLERR
jgi:ribosomal protein L11 methyltransferase